MPELHSCSLSALNANDLKYEQAVFTGLWGASGTGLTAASTN